MMLRSLAGLGLSVLILMLAGSLPAQNVSKTPASSSGPAAPTKPPVLDPGAVSDGLYRNAALGFTYKLPFGWVERTREIYGDASDDPAKAQVLLAVFERPPEAASDTPNPAVVIAAESVTSYPGLKTAADYFGPLNEVIAAKGLKAVNEPYGFSIGGKQLVRQDFSKKLEAQTMYQTSLAMLAKGYVVSFTFIGGSEDEVQQSVEGLSFAAASGSRRTKPK